jgi:hypothetical protein
MGIETGFERGRPAVQAATHATTVRVMGASSAVDAAAMSALHSRRVRDMADVIRAMRHLFARTRAAHAEQRKHANEKEATQNRHEQK